MKTLIAKYLEEKGLFVPAYKGGFLRNYDLFCRNTGLADVVLGEIVIKTGGSISVQIKLRLNNDHKNDLEKADLFFCINSDFEDRKVYDWRYLKSNIIQGGSVDRWLETSLEWVKIKKID